MRHRETIVNAHANSKRNGAYTATVDFSVLLNKSLSITLLPKYADHYTLLLPA